MIVALFRRLASTMRRRSWPSVEREPAPARLGARSPWKRSSGNGPEWHSRHRPTWRLATIARPRAGSPRAPVRLCGIASSTIANGRSCACAASAPSTAARPAAIATRTGTLLPEDLVGDGLEPRLGIGRLERAERARRVGRADAAGAFDVGQDAVRRLVHAGDRDAVIRRDEAVAGVDELRLGRRPALEQGGDRGGADLGLGVGRERRFWHRAGDRGVADDMDVRLQLRFEARRIDRAPAGAVRGAGRLGDSPGALRRDDVRDRRLVAAEIGDEGLGRGLDRRDLAAGRQRYPFEVRIELLPGGLEQALLRERVLGVEDDQLGARLLRLEEMGDEARALIRAGWAAEGVRRRRDDDRAAILHGVELTAQEERLRAGLPGMRHRLSGVFGVAGERVEAEIDAGREHEAVVGEPRAVAERDLAPAGIDCGGRLDRDLDAVLAQAVVAELLLGKLAQAGDDAVAERAGREGRARLDERHGGTRQVAFHGAGAGRAGKAAADHDDPRCRLTEGRARQERDRGGGAEAL